MATPQLELDCAQSVNDIITRHPTTIAVFNRFGLDTCCGGSLSVTDAAHANGVDPEILCSALHEVLQPQLDAR